MDKWYVVYRAVLATYDEWLFKPSKSTKLFYKTTDVTTAGQSRTSAYKKTTVARHQRYNMTTIENEDG